MIGNKFVSRKNDTDKKAKEKKGILSEPTGAYCYQKCNTGARKYDKLEHDFDAKMNYKTLHIVISHIYNQK